MGVVSIAVYGVLIAVTLPLLVSYMASGWVAKYTSPPYSFEDIPDLTGKVAIVTGTNTGIGYVTARELARKGATVISTARSQAKGEAAIAKMKREIGLNISADLRFMELDLASFASVRAFANRFFTTGLDIDIMVLNAGIMMAPFGKTVDGFEMQIGTNYLGHFLLVKSLLPVITSSKKTEPCRVVHVSSAAHEITYFSGMRFDNFDNDKDYNEILAYGQSKLANILFSNELSKRYNTNPYYTGRKIESNSLHPGTISTELTRHVLSWGDAWGMQNFIQTIKGYVEAAMFMTADDGALTQLYVATSPKVRGVTGKYFVPIGVERPPSLPGRNETLQSMLWELSEKYTGTA